MVEKEPHGTTSNNTLGHCQIKVPVSFSPWRDKTSQSVATMMYHHKMVVLAEMAITHLKTYYLLKHFHFLGNVKIILLNCMMFWKQEVLTQQYKSVKNPAGQHL